MHTPLLGTFCDNFQLSRTLPQDQLLREVLVRFSHIPYENLSKIIRAHEGLSTHLFQSPREILEGYWKHGSGGTCFPLTQTLVQLIAEIGYEAAPILADRRYGSDTHCAAVVVINGEKLLIDPGYLICTPIRIPAIGTLEHATPYSTLMLTRLPAEEKVDLATIEAGRPPRYRLTYKLEPVDDEAFKAAWERSFDWEMMTYPVVSSVRGDSHLYIQKNSLTIRSQGRVERTNLTEEDLVREVSQRLSLSPEIVKKALQCLR